MGDLMRHLAFGLLLSITCGITGACRLVKSHDVDLRQPRLANENTPGNQSQDQEIPQESRDNMTPNDQNEQTPSPTEADRPEKADRYFAYIGGGSAQIAVYQFDASTGLLALVEQIQTPQANPTFLAIHSSRSWLYAANESAQGGAIAFAIDRASGKLTQLNESLMKDFGPTHVGIDASGKWVMTASYNTGRVASFPIEANGRLGAVVAEPVAGENAHQILSGPDGAGVFVPCLGSNHIAQYQLNEANGVLEPQDKPRLLTGNGGPRHLAFHPNQQWAYVLNELSSTIQALHYSKASSQLSLFGEPQSTLLASVSNNSAAEVQVHPSGKFVYTSNRGHDSIALFTVNSDGSLSLQANTKTGGATPRHFSIDPTGRWLLVANQDSNQINVMSIDEATGGLTLREQRVEFTSPQFIEVVLLPSESI
ncbi:MAG: lactonase family protein [Oligoflexus sp.]